MQPQVQVRKVACAGCGVAISVPDDIDALTCTCCGSNLIIRRGEGYIASKLVEPSVSSVGEQRAEGSGPANSVGGVLDAQAGPAPLTCPYCGSADRLQKATAIQDAASYDIAAKRLNTPTVRLAERLALPMQPPQLEGTETRVVKRNRVAGCSYVILGLFAIIICAATGDSCAIMAGAVIALVLVANGVINWRGRLVRVIKSGPETWNEELNRYQNAQERCNHAYYCSRCDLVIVKGEAAAVPLSEWQKSLSTTSSASPDLASYGPLQGQQVAPA